ncbi:MAG: hypothetical protein DWQ47_02525 [Acidobacteria bacterium]|nr:MAG: hypothetical protein DWQ32_06075 [Acidobacteriota bacterium]REK01289.1 MAG: hypothetical protein DWQ38_02510 [Acidobacteriota bacterium]REK14245.1 MAG: hypothetical protein DWQ43_11765 [Acidobacteriota bacterium]REK44960.1 MAG: hypothetical protein DWQ47_02525 [Acidobacteriota bacterium]
MSIYEDLVPTDFDNIDTYDLLERPSKVSLDDFASPVSKGATVADLLESLPNILAGRQIKELAMSIVSARKKGKPVIWGLGGHVIKTGLAPILIDLARKGYVSAVATNGSVLVHDSEIALSGSTSEDVDATLGKGGFGAAKQTGELLNRSAQRAARDSIGLGEAVCVELLASEPLYRDHSLLCFCAEQKIPFTAHLTIGADIGHFHPGTDGAALGAATHHDFRLICSLVREMNGGGVYINLGSAVVLPEIFLKAVTVTRNLGFALEEITTANLDFIQHYRPLTNVVRRPTSGAAGRGYSITGHHELTLPLLSAAICEME